MRFERRVAIGCRRLPHSAKLGLAFLAWLVFIACFHYRLNIMSSDRQVVRMGYMPVVTNLAAPLLDHVSRQSIGVRFEAVKFSSFAEMAAALRNDSIQAAFIIAPLAVVLRQQGEDVKVVMIGNRNESTLVARKALKAKRLEDLSGATIAVPMRYSGHNLCLQKMIEEKGLDGDLRVVEMNPPDMASALISGGLDAYFVGEPFAAQTVLNDDAEVVAHVASMWPNFICNLVLVKNRWLRVNESAAQTLVEAAARASLWAASHQQEAARIVSSYWNQSVALIRHTLTPSYGQVIYDRFVPQKEELQEMADLMVRYELIERADITGLIDDRFALAAYLEGIEDLDSVLLP